MNYSVFRLIVLLMFILLLLPGSGVGSDINVKSLFQQGNEAYSRGDYEQAISSYEQITEHAGYAPPVLFNLANSYAQSRKIGKAVLSYERGLRLTPSDLDISGNLELVRKESGLFPMTPSAGERFFRLLNQNQWSGAILFALVLCPLFLFAAMRFRLSRQLTISVSLTCFLLLCLSTAGAWFHYQFFNPSVVVTPDARLFISPFITSKSIGTIQEGRLVYPEKTHGNFTYVTDETDRKGWIPNGSLEAVAKAAGPGS
jgi:hypothetical protein